MVPPRMRERERTNWRRMHELGPLPSAELSRRKNLPAADPTTAPSGGAVADNATRGLSGVQHKRRYGTSPVDMS